MNVAVPKFILGSRSPRRLELLSLVVPASRIEVCPPTDANEPSFAGMTDEVAIGRQLLEVARLKCDDVWAANSGAGSGVRDAVVITADTIVVARDRAGVPHVLGQPPDDPPWQDVVGFWFRDLLAGRPHVVSTGMCVVLPDGRRIETTATTEVTFRPDVDRFLDWYLSTGESRGKAGGYAIQGAASVFVETVRGSLSNVIGLPLEELMRILTEAGIAVEGAGGDG